jgi:hypothetical protein
MARAQGVKVRATIVEKTVSPTMMTLSTGRCAIANARTGSGAYTITPSRSSGSGTPGISAPSVHVQKRR